MRNILISVLTFVAMGLAHAAELSYGGYLRSPMGVNDHGGKLIQINNFGSFANEFRIGNETPYIEASFTAHLLKPSKGDEAFFDTNLMFAYGPSFSTQYGDINTSTTDVSSHLIQAFIRGGNIDGIHAIYWAGKRYYRDADIHMNDFFYFADMSGSGGGVEDISLMGGKFAAAYLFSSDQALANPSQGRPTKQALDFRLQDISLNSTDTLMFWLAEGYTAPGVAGATTYSAATGTAFGVKHHRKLDQGSNDLALVWGNGVMEKMTLDSDQYNSDAASVSSNSRVRFVENYYAELNSKWGMQAAFVHDSYKGTNGGYTIWNSIGVRPVYYFTDRMHLVMQFGHSDVDGRTLDRITVAPEIAIGKGYYQRPVIRFYMTENMWNDKNKSATDTNSIISKNSTVSGLSGRNDLFQMGFEGEVWF